MKRVQPLGIFGRIADQKAFSGFRDELTAMIGEIPADVRPSIAEYLRSGAVVVALMEYTTDVIGGRFALSGGSAIVTDGEFFWRRDAADYVETYGVGLPDNFLRHGEMLRWHMSPLSREEIIEVDDFLVSEMRNREGL